MSMIALLAGAALADGTLVRLDTVRQGAGDPAVMTRQQAFPDAAWNDTDTQALTLLETRLEESWKLAMELDGEQAIMEQLQASLDAITALRDQSDRDQVYAALACQGYAVHRYFQHDLADDPMADPYRTTVEGLEGTQIRAWVDAIAMAPEIEPHADHIPEAPEREGFQALRDALLALPQATIEAPSLPAGATLVVDGQRYQGRSTRVPPGLHRVAVLFNGALLYRAKMELAPGATQTLPALMAPASLDELVERMAGREGLIVLEPAVREVLAALPEPVHLVVGQGDSEVFYRLQGGAIERQVEVLSDPQGAWWLGGGVGLGWLNDRDWYLENATEGATDTGATTNAVAPTLGLSVEHRGRLTVGAGLDLVAPLGRYQRLPVGDGAQRVRIHPHLSAGVPWLQATAGYLSPSQIALGLRPRIPLGGDFSLQAQGLYGIGLTRYRVGLPDVQASNVYGAWLTVGWGAAL